MVATKEVVNAHYAVLKEMAEAIREAEEIPSGHLYTAVMDQLPLDRYEFYIGILKGAGVVKEEYNLLTWIGPKVGGE